MLSMI